MATEDSGYRRVDVFSLKGGVGKTSLSILLARAHLRHRQEKSVLLIDADLTGTCLGDLLEPLTTWSSEGNLAHLICGRPERLGELLEVGKLPVYIHGGGSEIQLQPGFLPRKAFLFCPSQAETTAADWPVVRRPLLQALLSHENAGGFISFVIEEVIKAVRKVVPEVSAVIVDHGPGLAALQYANLDKADGEDRKALFVTSRDAVDLRAIHALELSLKERAKFVTWVVNRVPGSAGADWQGRIPEKHHQGYAWYTKGSLPLYHNATLAEAYAEAAPLVAKELDAAVDDIYAKVFG